MQGEQKAVEEDWEKCKAWLLQVSPMSVRSAREVRSESDLFKYLKVSDERAER